LGTEHLIDIVPSPNDSQEVALSIYTRDDLISVAIEKEKEMSQSLLTCPRTSHRAIVILALSARVLLNFNFRTYEKNTSNHSKTQLKPISAN